MKKTLLALLAAAVFLGGYALAQTSRKQVDYLAILNNINKKLDLIATKLDQLDKLEANQAKFMTQLRIMRRQN